MRASKGDELFAMFCDGHRIRKDVALAFVELVNGCSDPFRYVNLEVDVEVLGKQFQQLIVISHGLALVYEIAYGIVVDQGADVAASKDAVEGYRYRVRGMDVRVEGRLSAARKMPKRDRNAENQTH